MARIELGRADLCLFANPATTQVVVPRLLSAPHSRATNGTTVRFEGDTFATPFRGPGRRRSYDLTARYADDEHEQLAALLVLLDETAPDAPDGRLLLRTHLALAPGLNDAVAVVTFDVQVVPSGEAPGVFDVQFTATVVEHTFEF